MPSLDIQTSTVQDLYLRPSDRYSATYKAHRRASRATDRSAGKAASSSRSRSRPSRRSASCRSDNSSSSGSQTSGCGRESRRRPDGATAAAIGKDDRAKLVGLFLDTKVEMMRIVDTDSKLKLDISDIKERFYTLLKNFEAFEQRHPEYDTQAVPAEVCTKVTRGRHKSASSEKRRKSMVRRSHTLSRRSDLSNFQSCPNNTRVSAESDNVANWASLLGTNDTAELTSAQYTHYRDISGVDTTVDRVENISEITRCSNVTTREQFSQSRITDITGPLSSTMSYPQYSTPEKKQPPTTQQPQQQPSREGVRSCSRRLCLDSRPAPAGGDVVVPPSLRTPRAHVLVAAADSDSDATPLAVRRPRAHSARGSEDSGLGCGADTPSTVVGDSSGGARPSFPHTSDISLEAVTPLAKSNLTSSDLMSPPTDSRLRRQTAQPCLSQAPRSPLGLSETDLIDPSSFFETTITDVQCSMEATRGASVANLSTLSAASSAAASDGTPPSTDVTASTGVESSYKESDATCSSSPPGDRAWGLPTPGGSGLVRGRRVLAQRAENTQQEAGRRRFYSRRLISTTASSTSDRAFSQYTSGTSTSSYGGLLAPANSPNATSDSAAAAAAPPRKPVPQAAAPVSLGSRPPCIGSSNNNTNINLIPSNINAVPKALSDSECSRTSATTTVSCMPSRGSFRAKRPKSGQPLQQPLESTSLGGSDQSLNSSEGSYDKSSTGSGVEVVASGAGRSSTVRRSLSRRIRKLGKQLLRGTPRPKPDTHHSA